MPLPERITVAGFSNSGALVGGCNTMCGLGDAVLWDTHIASSVGPKGLVCRGFGLILGIGLMAKDQGLLMDVHADGVVFRGVTRISGICVHGECENQDLSVDSRGFG
jgi:hypothetical protein